MEKAEKVARLNKKKRNEKRRGMKRTKAKSEIFHIRRRNHTN